MGRKFKRVIEKDAFDALPAHDVELYDEKDGKYHFNAVTLTADEATLASLRDESAKHRTKNIALTAQLEAFKGLDATAVPAQLLELEALRAEKEAGGDKDGKKFDAAVAARVKVETAPLTAKLTELTKTNETLAKENGDHKASGEKRQKHDAVREALVSLGADKDVYAGKFPSGLRWAEENAVIGDDGKITDKETGLPLKDALKHYKDEGQFPSWWGTSEGGDARGSNGNKNGPTINPWMPDTWNASKQGSIIAADPNRAAALARAAGVDVDAVVHPKGGVPKYNQFD